MNKPRRCEICGKDISKKRGHALTCSVACRKAKHRLKCDKKSTLKLPDKWAGDATFLVNTMHEYARQQIHSDDLMRAIAIYQSQGKKAQVEVLIAFQRFRNLQAMSERLWD